MKIITSNPYRILGLLVGSSAAQQNRQQPRLEVLYEIADLLSVDIKDLLVSNKLKMKFKE